jgi:hypothetical protein
VQRPQDEQLLEILREGAQEREDRVPEDRDLQHPHAAEPVAQRSRKPAPERRDQQRHGADQTGFAVRQAPQRDDGRDHEAVHLDIERIKRPAAKASAHRAPLLGVQLAKPGEHRFPLEFFFREKSLRPFSAPRARGSHVAPAWQPSAPQPFTFPVRPALISRCRIAAAAANV